MFPQVCNVKKKVDLHETQIRTFTKCISRTLHVKYFFDLNIYGHYLRRLADSNVDRGLQKKSSRLFTTSEVSNKGCKRWYNYKSTTRPCPSRTFAGTRGRWPGSEEEKQSGWGRGKKRRASWPHRLTDRGRPMRRCPPPPRRRSQQISFRLAPKQRGPPGVWGPPTSSLRPRYPRRRAHVQTTPSLLRSTLDVLYVVNRGVVLLPVKLLCTPTPVFYSREPRQSLGSPCPPGRVPRHPRATNSIIKQQRTNRS
jgi:hypothetical protein